MTSKNKSTYYSLDEKNTDPARIKKEREKARKLKKSQWWLNLLQKGECHYCGLKFKASQLTMDHVVPLARGGTSTPGNLVPSCKNCNSQKSLDTPVEQLFKELEKTKKPKEGQS